MTASVPHHGLVIFPLTTLVLGTVAPGQVEHDQVPRFPRRTPHKQQERGSEVPEIGMLVELGKGLADFGHAEKRATDDGEHEEKNDEEEAKRGQGLRGIEQCVEYNLQFLGLLDESENATDP